VYPISITFLSTRILKLRYQAGVVTPEPVRATLALKLIQAIGLPALAPVPRSVRLPRPVGPQAPGVP
jgi:hypothetical protein